MQSKFLNKKSRWCVFTSAGDYNNVLAWTRRIRRPNWDLIVAFYGDNEANFNKLRNISKIVFKMKGSKFQNLKKLYDDQPSLFSQYDFVFVTDDDLQMNSTQISELFRISEYYDFWVCQPAFDRKGRVSHEITAQAGKGIRVSNFVELTCPLFRRDKLFEFLQVYDRKLVGWGVDWWFCNLFDANNNRKLAIVDDISIVNPHGHQRIGKTREIEKLQPSELREAHWREVQDARKLQEYEHKTFSRIKRRKFRERIFAFLRR